MEYYYRESLRLVPINERVQASINKMQNVGTTTDAETYISYAERKKLVQELVPTPTLTTANDSIKAVI